MSNPRQRGAISLAVAIVVAAGAVGAGVGVGLWQAVDGSEAETQVVEAALDQIPTARCPGEAQVGVLHRGDRVLATGRSAGGDWVEVRDPLDLGARVWVLTQYLIPDRSIDGLPEHACAPPTTTSTTATTTTTSADSDEDQPPVDTAGPVITNVSVTPGVVYEQHQGGCTPTSATVQASASDPSGVASLTASWAFSTVNQPPKPVPAQFGPYADGHVTSNNPLTVTIAIRARDGRGNTSTASTQVVLSDWGDCIG